MNETYNLVFKFGELGMYGLIPGIKEAMQHELMRVYNIYANKCNSGITEKLNAVKYLERNGSVETRGLSFYIFQDAGYERKWYFHIVKFPGMKI